MNIVSLRHHVLVVGLTYAASRFWRKGLRLQSCGGLALSRRWHVMLGEGAG